MKVFGCILGFLLCIIPLTLSSQRYISGCITDAETNEPITGVSVFIANTTIGASTDAEGNYRLKIPGEGSYRLVVSHVGYESVFRDIELGNVSVIFDTALNANEMEEVTVAAKVRFRTRDINLFWKTILGKPPSKRTLHVINPDDVYYYYNTKTRILKVTCRVPLNIINHETGYHVQLILDHFTHNYNTEISSWEYEYMFHELEPENQKQKNVWDKNRMKVYQVSLANFIKALYHNTLMEKGYLLTYPGKINPLNNLPHALYETPMSILSVDSVDGSKTLYVEDLALLCFGKPVDEKILNEVERAKNGIHNWSRVGLFRNVLQTPDEPVHIFSDGTFCNPLLLKPHLSSSLLGINQMLPLDYVPDIDLPSPSEADDVDENDLIDRFSQQLTLFPQEKIHLHTDKPYYITGERIWFRAHLADAATHYPVSYSRYVYVELINPLDTVVTRVKIRQEENAYHGYLLIPEDVPEGDYTLRAYTTFMQNQDEHYFCTKGIRIGDPQFRAVHTDTEFSFESGMRVHVTFRFSHVSSSEPLVPKSVKVKVNDGRLMNLKVNDDGTASINFNLPATSRKRTMLLEVLAFNNPYRQFIQIPVPDDDFDVTFYPEGGSLMQGAFCKVAFKAMKSNGQSTNISGKVYDQTGTEINEFTSEHLGMGSFSLLAEKGKTYHIICENDKGQSKRFDLPVAVDRGYALTVSQVRDRIYVSVLKPDTNDNDSLHVFENQQIYLLAHTRGLVHFAVLWNHENALVFYSNQFPSGILHLILFDAGLNPVSERLLFINNEDRAQVSYQQDQEKFVARSLVKNRVTLTDIDGEPLSGNFSLAVTSDREVTPDSTTNILTHLLLSSDLRGNIENPAYYFKNKNTSMMALDLLMLTQGWRRYNIAELTQGHFVLPTFPLESFPQISGFVQNTTLIFKQQENSTLWKPNLTPVAPVRNIEVKLLSLKYDFAEITQTDNDGRFYFRGIELPDSTGYIVQTKERTGLKGMNLVLDKETFPERTLFTSPPAVIDKNQFARYADKAELKFINEGGIRVYHLSEVTITAQRKPPSKSMYYDTNFTIYTINEEQLKKYPASNILLHLSRLPGIQVDFVNKLVYIRGIGSTGSNTPLLLVDDMVWDFEDIDAINPFEVAQIDLLSGANPFGMRGANGVISIITKRGEIIKDESEPFHIRKIMPLGYQTPVEFYAPKYDTPEKRYAQTPDLRTTIHWQPVVKTDNEGVASFEFYTADEQTSYTVIIEGLADDGSIIRQEEKLWREGE